MALQCSGFSRPRVTTPHRAAHSRKAANAAHRPCVVAAAAVTRRALLGCTCASGGACRFCGRQAWYDRYFALNMRYGMDDYEAAVAPLKQLLFGRLLQPLVASATPAAVLEVGIGTGPNLPFLLQQPLELQLTGLEPNLAMFEYAQQAAAAVGCAPGQLRLVAGDAQRMPFDNGSFDAAVMTLVLCSVSQPAQVLSELLRVLKPGGQLLVIEHVIAPQLSLLQLQQRLLDPLQRLLADNCHLTRDAAATLLASGLVPQPLPPLPRDAAVQDMGPLLQRQPATSTRTQPNSSSGNGSGDATAGLGLPGGAAGAQDLWRFEVDNLGLIAPHVAGILRKPL